MQHFYLGLEPMIAAIVTVTLDKYKTSEKQSETTRVGKKKLVARPAKPLVF